MALQSIPITLGDSFTFQAGDVVKISIDSEKEEQLSGGRVGTRTYNIQTLESQPYDGTSDTIMIGNVSVTSVIDPSDPYYVPELATQTGFIEASLKNVTSGIVTPVYDRFENDILPHLDSFVVVREGDNPTSTSRVLSEEVGEYLASKIKENSDAIDAVGNRYETVGAAEAETWFS